MSVLGVLSAPRREVRVATVISVDGSVATVDLAGTETPAQIPTVPAFTLVAGNTVFLIPRGDTWLIFAAL